MVLPYRQWRYILWPDIENLFGIFFIFRDCIALFYQFRHYLRSLFAVVPEVFTKIQITRYGYTHSFCKSPLFPYKLEGLPRGLQLV